MIKRTYIILISLFLILSLFRLSFGNEIYNLSQVVSSFSNNSDPVISFNIQTLRLPIILASLIFGTYISLSGYMLQKVTKNNIAEPSILGLSSFVILIQLILKVVLGLFELNLFMNLILDTVIITFVILILLSKSKVQGILSINKLILYGIGLNLFLSSMITFIKSYVDAAQYEQITILVNGNLDYYDSKFLFIHLILISLLVLYLLIKTQEYKILDLNIQMQNSLGMSYNKFLIMNILIISFLTTLSVLSIGVISLLGLVSPQIIKMLIGNKHKHIVILSPILAANILIMGDLISKYLLGFVIPLDIVTTIILAPIFILLLFKKESL